MTVLVVAATACTRTTEAPIEVSGTVVRDGEWHVLLDEPSGEHRTTLLARRVEVDCSDASPSPPPDPSGRELEDPGADEPSAGSAALAIHRFAGIMGSVAGP